MTRGSLQGGPGAEAFDADGWFHTGDRGQVDGWRFHFQGRLSDMIKTAGANVAPSEVVVALRQVEGVREAYVLGLPDPVRGQVVVAAVVPSTACVLDAEASFTKRSELGSPPTRCRPLSCSSTRRRSHGRPSFKVRYVKLAELLADRIDRSGS